MLRHITKRGGVSGMLPGDCFRFPLGPLGSDDVYAHRFELVSFTADGMVNVRRLHDGLERTVSASWASRYACDENTRRAAPVLTSMRDYRKAHPATATRIEGREFFVSVIDGERVAYLAGPFETHDDAIFAVPAARRKAGRLDSRAVWYAFGTCSAPVGAIERTLFGKDVEEEPETVPPSPPKARRARKK